MYYYYYFFFKWQLRFSLAPQALKNYLRQWMKLRGLDYLALKHFNDRDKKAGGALSQFHSPELCPECPAWLELTSPPSSLLFLQVNHLGHLEGGEKAGLFFWPMKILCRTCTLHAGQSLMWHDCHQDRSAASWPVQSYSIALHAG